MISQLSFAHCYLIIILSPLSNDDIESAYNDFHADYNDAAADDDDDDDAEDDDGPLMVMTLRMSTLMMIMRTMGAVVFFLSE